MSNPSFERALVLLDLRASHFALHRMMNDDEATKAIDQLLNTASNGVHAIKAKEKSKAELIVELNDLLISAKSDVVSRTASSLIEFIKKEIPD